MRSGLGADRAGAVTGLLVVLAVLAVDPAGWYPFGPVKWTAISTLVLAAAACAVRGGGRRSWKVLDRAVVVLLAAMAVGALQGVDGLYAWTGTPERSAGVLLWVLCALTLVTGQAIGSTYGGQGPHGAALSPAMDRVLAGVLVAAVGLGVIAVAEVLGWEPGVLDVGSRLTATMGSSAYLGAAVALLLPVVVAVTVDPRSRRAVRAVAGLATVGLVVAGIGSGARAAWVGLALALAVTVVARRRTLLHHRTRAWRAGLALGVVIVAVLAVTPAGSRLLALTDADAAGGQGRLDEWRVAAAVLVEHPVTGVGPEGYRIAFADGVDAAYQERHGRDPLPDRAHSGPLDIALAGGPVALGAWLVVLATVGRSAWRALRSGPSVDVGLAAALVAHWTGQLFLFPLAELEPIAWLFAGIVVARDPAFAPNRPSAHGRSSTRHRATPLVSGVLAVGAAMALVAGALAVAADRQAATAASTGSVAAAERAAELRPDVVRHHLLLARLRLADDQGFVPALDAIDDGLAVSPRDPILRLAQARHLVGRALATEVPAHADLARRTVWRALADDPLDTELWALAVVLALATA